MFSPDLGFYGTRNQLAASRFAAAEETLQQDFVAAMKRYGGQVAAVTLPPALSRFVSGDFRPAWEVKMPRDAWNSFSRGVLAGSGHFLESLLGKLDQLLNLRDFFFGLQGSVFTFRFVEQSVFLGAALYSGCGGPVQGMPTEDLVTPWELRNFFERDARPLCLKSTPYTVHRHGPLHGYVGLLHDDLHLLRNASVPQIHRRVQLALFDEAAFFLPHLRESGCESEAMVRLKKAEDIGELLLDGPFEDQLGEFSASIFYARLFQQLNSYLTPVDVSAPEHGFVVNFGARLRERFRGHPLVDSVLAGYDRQVSRKWAPT